MPSEGDQVKSSILSGFLSIERKAKELGLICKWEEKITPGDMYLAERNTGVILLECKTVDESGSFIIPTTNDYCFDVWECVKVVEPM